MASGPRRQKRRQASSVPATGRRACCIVLLYCTAERPTITPSVRSLASATEGVRNINNTAYKLPTTVVTS
jgi:hypothetical protein